MPQITKTSASTSNFHLKALPSAFMKDISSHIEGKKFSHQTFEDIGKSFIRAGHTQLRKGLEPKQLHSPGHPLTALALSVLFPTELVSKLENIAELPEKTIEEQTAKEAAFRQLISTEFTLKEVVNDENNALRAIISALNPEIDSGSQLATAQILRGDIIDHVRKHPELKEDIQGWSAKISNPETPIGKFEIQVMSEILESPIHILSYHDTKSALAPTPMPERALYLYFDPIRSYHQPAHPIR